VVRSSATQKIRIPEALYKDQTLSYAEIEQGLSILVKYAKHFNPNFIFGINRGGAIVGGLLAKQLVDQDEQTNLRPNIILLDVNNESDPPVIEQRHDAAAPLKYYRRPLEPSSVKRPAKALLVDDMGKTGSSMTLAYKYLKEHHPCLEVKRVVMLRAEMHAQGPYAQSPEYEMFPFWTDKASVLLPWDRQKPAEHPK
jgi:hypoxanthine phosphoribosyltransferase